MAAVLRGIFLEKHNLLNIAQAYVLLVVYQHVHSQATIWRTQNGVKSLVDVRKDIITLAGAAGAALGLLDEVLRLLINYCVLKHNPQCTGIPLCGPCMLCEGLPHDLGWSELVDG